MHVHKLAETARMIVIPVNAGLEPGSEGNCFVVAIDSTLTL